MSNYFDNDELDRLLAQPANLADKGFGNRLEKRIRQQHHRLRLIYGLLGGLWLILALAFGAPARLVAAVVKVSESWNSFIQSLMSGGMQDLQFPLEYGLLIAVVCALIAVTSPLLKD